VAPSSVLCVYYDKICLKFASHAFLLNAVYICQKSLNFIYAFKCYQQIAINIGPSWPHFSWPTLYMLLPERIQWTQLYGRLTWHRIMYAIYRNVRYQILSVT